MRLLVIVVGIILATASLLAGLGLPISAPDKTSIVLQSTTSTQNSGLYDFILPIFEEKTNIKVNVVAVGTGQALENAKNGDGDVLLVHAQSEEEKFVAKSYGVKRFDVMYNDFIIVGPATDPAHIAGLGGVLSAFKKIAAAKAIFISRGDDSGTHKKEKSLWQAASLDVTSASGKWYRETGSGMGATLNTAVGMDGYVMTDRSTWISFKNKGSYRIHVEGDDRLFNQYGVILVNPKNNPNVNEKAGQTFIDWITGKEGQQAIAGYKLDGQQLFFPNAEPGY